MKKFKLIYDFVDSIDIGATSPNIGQAHVILREGSFLTLDMKGANGEIGQELAEALSPFRSPRTPFRP